MILIYRLSSTCSDIRVRRTRDRAVESDVNKNSRTKFVSAWIIVAFGARSCMNTRVHARMYVSHARSRCMRFPVDYQKFMRSKASKSSKLTAQDLWDFLSLSLVRSQLLQRLTQRNMHASTVNDARPSPSRFHSPLSRLYAMRLA